MFSSAKFPPMASPQHDPLGGFGFDGGVVEELRLTRGAITEGQKPVQSSFRNSFIEEQDEIPQVLGIDATFRAPLTQADPVLRDAFSEPGSRFARSQKGQVSSSRRNIPADATWVTIFGFQPSLAGQVKAQVENGQKLAIFEPKFYVDRG